MKVNSELDIDGSMGEGGGQVLRTCLSLSLITGTAFHIANIRAGRSNPGLSPQHLKAVEAAAVIGNASVEGANLRSTSLTFSPQKICSGKYTIDIGTAGSIALVLQTICIPLSFADSTSKLTISGGTHVPWSPSYDYIKHHWVVFLTKLGYDFSLELKSAGFYPQGGGQITAEIQPINSVLPLNLIERRNLKQIRGYSAVANLTRKIAVRQRQQVIRRLGDIYKLNDIRISSLPAKSKGTAICLIGEFENTQCCYFALGELGKPAEKVADEVVDQIEKFLATGAAIDEFLADQLLLPLSMAKNVSKFSTAKISNHLITNANVIERFLPVSIQIKGKLNSPGLVMIEPHQT